jgi:hypothetical protein
MKSFVFPILATVFLLDMGMAMAAELQVSYKCQPGKIILKVGDEIINPTLQKTVSFTPTGDNLNLVVGDFDYLLWPRHDGSNYRKALSILKNGSEGLQLQEEIEMGGPEEKTISVDLPIEREESAVRCQVKLFYK